MVYRIWLKKCFNSLYFFLAAAQSPWLARSQAHSTAQEKKFDLLSDLGGDIFAAPPTHTSSSTNFANFAHFPSQSGKIASFFLKGPTFHPGWCRLKKIFRIMYPLVCHHPMHCPDIVFISTFIVYVNFSLYMAAAPQGNSNTNFANFEAFGNTAIPSHLSTSPPTKSFSSGTPHPTIVSLPPYPHTVTLTLHFSYLFLT